MFVEKADYFRMVNLVIPGQVGGNTGTQFTWKDQPDIRNARMIAIEAYFAQDMSNCFPEQTAVLPDVLANKVSLRFETNDPDDIGYKLKGKPGNFTGTLDTIQWLPITKIHTIQSTAGTPGPFNREMLMWKDRYIIWQKSAVFIAPGGLGNTTDIAICLGCYYSFLDAQGNPLTR